MKLSTALTIKQRIDDAKASYKACDNISEFIKPGSFIPFTENIINIINMVNNNEEMYNKIINMDKIQDKYKDIKVKF